MNDSELTSYRVSKKDLKELDKLVLRELFKTRAEAVRQAITNLLVEENKMTKIIGIVGNAGAGKTTIAGILYQYLNIDIKPNEKIRFVNLADPVRFISGYLFGGYTYPKDKNRELLQGIGQGMRDLCFKVFGHTEVWVDKTFRALREEEVDIAIIGDVRYLNEAEAIIEKGGQLLWVACRSDIRRKRIEKRDEISFTDKFWNDMHKHSSETEVKTITEYFKEHGKITLYENTRNLNQQQLKKEVTRIGEILKRNMYAYK